jgi:hypothetical protein
MMAASNKQIHERRKELEEQLAAALKSYSRASGDGSRAEREVQHAVAAVERVRVEKAKGIIGTDLDVAIEAERRARENMATVRAEGNAAHYARQEAEAALDGYLEANFEVFAEQAQKHSERAEEAAKLANRSLLRAENLWRAAEEAWRPLCRAKKLQGVPPCALPPRTDLVLAQPPSVRAEAEDAAA